MTYKVTLSSGYNYSVKKSQPLNYKTSLSYKVEVMPQRLNELEDVEISANHDMYVLMYDASTGKWKDRNPDEVLSASVTDTVQPGLPADFMNQMDISMDNKIDVDAGTF